MKKTLFLCGWLISVTALAQPSCFSIVPKPSGHDFVLVIDRSGSMSGLPMQQAIGGAQAFINKLKQGDRAAIVSFGSEVDVVAEMMGDRQQLLQSLVSIRSRGSTVLYDALVRASSMAIQSDGEGIVVFLTDGSDTGSRYTARDLESMGRSGGIYLYGIGLGNVDKAVLQQISVSTGGTLETTSDPRSLEGLYDRVLTNFYSTYGEKSRQTSSYVVRSLPAGRTVRIDGKVVGQTPLKLDNWAPGDTTVEVDFDRGTWRCACAVEAGQRAVLDAREDELGHDLWVVSRPRGASVFINDVYVGMTSIRPVRMTEKDWTEKVVGDEGQLRIPLLARGKHMLRIVAMPDFDFGPELELQFPFVIDNNNRVLSIDILQGRVLYEDGQTEEVRGEQGSADPFEELDALFGD